MELRQLRYFLAVADERSFSRAALRLHISQPPLSTQVMSLEDELGLRLFDRSSRGVSLTAAGAIFYEEMRAVLARLESGSARARQAGQGVVGSLSVGFVSIADYGVLPPALKDFRAGFPAVEVQLHELTTDAQLREIRAGRLDLGIGIGPLEQADIAFEPLLREKLVLAAPLRHARLPGKGAVDLRTFSAESFIVPPRELAPGLHDLITGLCRSSGFAPRITQHARQMQTVISLVACGLGLALVPASLQKLRRAGVQYRALRGSGASLEIGLLRMRRQHSPLADNFAAALRQSAREG